MSEKIYNLTKTVYNQYVMATHFMIVAISGQSKLSSSAYLLVNM